MFDKAEGTVQNIAGKVQDAFGAATGDASTQAEGKARQVAGAAQKGYGEVVNQVREVALTNPVATVAAAVGAGFFLGALWATRR
jgi:uncharacterized protein YjbJ (UPF0337 family)